MYIYPVDFIGCPVGCGGDMENKYTAIGMMQFLDINPDFKLL